MTDNRNAPVERPVERRKTVVYRMEGGGPFGCLAGLMIACLLVGALTVVFVFGFITLTVAVWIGCGVVLLAVITAVLRLIRR